MSWDPVHNFLDMVCSGGGKKARARWRKAEQRDRDVRAGRHIVTDPNIGWGRNGAHNINPDAGGAVNIERTVENQNGSINTFRLNTVPGVVQQGKGPMPRHGYRIAEEISSQGLSQRARALGALARNNSGDWRPQPPLLPMPQMRPPGVGPRFRSRPEGCQEGGRTTPPPYLTQEPPFRSGSSYISREPRSRRSSRTSELNLRQRFSSHHARESSSRSSHRENSRSPTHPHRSRRSEPESDSCSRQTSQLSHIPISQVSKASTVRVRTSKAPLGDMSRTFVEGMVLIEDGDEELTLRPRPL
jgi:hypothetical protein